MSDALRVIKIWKTIQGEGPFSGTPAVFVRLAGCNLSCPWCDTDHATGMELKSIRQVEEEVSGLAGEIIRLAVVTGGEPFIQTSTVELLRSLTNKFSVQVETNGTQRVLGSIPRNIVVVCSPKPEEPVIEGWRFRVDAWKYIVQDGMELDRGIPVEMSLPTNWSNVYIQPMDEHEEERNQKNLELAKRICLTYGYRLSIQMHKMIGVE